MTDKSVDDAMESAVGAHFSGLRLEALRLPTPSAPSSPSSSSGAVAAGALSNGTVFANGVAHANGAELVSPSALRQPFVIGNFSRPYPLYC
jgi:uridine kinase